MASSVRTRRAGARASGTRAPDCSANRRTTRAWRTSSRAAARARSCSRRGAPWNASSRSSRANAFTEAASRYAVCARCCATGGRPPSPAQGEKPSGLRPVPQVPQEHSRSPYASPVTECEITRQVLSIAGDFEGSAWPQSSWHCAIGSVPSLAAPHSSAESLNGKSSEQGLPPIVACERTEHDAAPVTEIASSPASAGSGPVLCDDAESPPPPTSAEPPSDSCITALRIASDTDVLFMPRVALGAVRARTRADSSPKAAQSPEYVTEAARARSHFVAVRQPQTYPFVSGGAPGRRASPRFTARHGNLIPSHREAPRASRARFAMATIDRRTSSGEVIASSNASRAARGPFGVTAAISNPYRSTAVIVALVASATPASPTAYASTPSAWSSFMCRRISDAAAERQSGSAARYSSAPTQDIRPNPPM